MILNNNIPSIFRHQSPHIIIAVITNIVNCSICLVRLNEKAKSSHKNIIVYLRNIGYLLKREHLNIQTSFPTPFEISVRNVC